MTAKSISEKVSESKTVEKERKREIDLQKSIDKKGVIALIGELLQRQREHIGASQRDIAAKMDYPYINFISMLEIGAAKIPLGRIPNIVAAYKFGPEFSMILTKVLFPDTWKLFCTIIENEPFSKKAKDVEAIIDKSLKEKLKEFRLPSISI